MSLLDRLSDEKTWSQFREYRSKHSLMSIREFDELDGYIAEKRYLPIARSLSFSLPEKKLINKRGTNRKRTVYIFPEDELWVLKMLTWLLYRYDGAVEPCCFSFRPNHTVKMALERILAMEGLKDKYVLKADIHDYFNSIPVDRLTDELAGVITDDERLLGFLQDFFTVNKAIYEGQVIEESRGAMAGMPLSAFIANIYLADLDRLMLDQGISYYRYSDDIIMFCDSRQQLDRCYEMILRHINEKGLQLNPDKVTVSLPGEPWDFLGFRYDNGQVDLAQATVTKLKTRIRRKAMALYRWRVRKQAGYERTAKAMIRKFNRKFYDFDDEYEFTWSRWFFPVLTTDRSLRVIDRYLISYIRYLFSGRHYKGNYAVSYQQIKDMGYHSLVHEYHRYRDGEILGKEGVQHEFSSPAADEA